MMNLQLTQQDKQALAHLDKMFRQRADEIKRAMPAGQNFERLLARVLLAIRKNRQLLMCRADSLFFAAREAFSYGLEISDHRGLAYLVPFNDRKLRCKVAQLQIGYRGLVEFVRRTGQLEKWDAETVHAGDEFDYQLGDDEYIKHKPSMRPDRASQPVTYVYVIFHLKGGVRVRNVWTAAMIDAHKAQYSQAWGRAESEGTKDSPWHTAWRSMAIKTVVRDTINKGRLPLSDQVVELIDRDGFETGETLDGSVVTSAAAMAIESTMDRPTDDVPQLTSEANPTASWYSGPGCPELAAQLAMAENLGQVTLVEESALDQAGDDEAAIKYATQECEKRREEIRTSRSEPTAEEKAELAAAEQAGN